MQQLIEAITKHTEAINALVESNARMIMILAEGAMDEQEQPLRYMDGTAITNTSHQCKCR